MRELNWVYYYSNVEKDQNQYTHDVSPKLTTSIIGLFLCPFARFS